MAAAEKEVAWLRVCAATAARVRGSLGDVAPEATEMVGRVVEGTTAAVKAVVEEPCIATAQPRGRKKWSSAKRHEHTSGIIYRQV